LRIKLPLVVEVLRDNGRFQISRASATAPAAAEATASDGSMQLTLRLHKTKLKGREPVFFQIAVKNVGKKVLEFDGPDVFWDPSSPYGIAVEYQDPAGNPAGTPTLKHGAHHHRTGRGQGFMGMTAAEEDRLIDLLDGWNREGLSAEQVADKLGDYYEDIRKDHLARGLSIEVLPPQMWVMPGGAVATPTWVDPDPDRPGGKPLPPVIGFAEHTVQLWRAGKYRVRANTDLFGDMMVRTKDKKRKPGETVLRTPFIRIEVSR
jgi:hypothetical protein